MTVDVSKIISIFVFNTSACLQANEILKQPVRSSVSVLLLITTTRKKEKRTKECIDKEQEQEQDKEKRK